MNRKKTQVINDNRDNILNDTQNIKNNLIINVNQLISLNDSIDIIDLIDKIVSEHNINVKNNVDLFINSNNEYWINKMGEYINYLEELLNKDITFITVEELKELAIDFNKNYLIKYYNEISVNLFDLIDKREIYANQLAVSLIDIQTLEINAIGVEEFIKLDLNNQDIQFKQYINTNILIILQNTLKDIIINNPDTLDTSIIKQTLYNNQIKLSINKVDNIIKSNQIYYEDLNKKYQKINYLIEEIKEKYNQKQEQLNKYANAIVPKQPQNKKINLHLAKMFNQTYTLNKYTSIDKNGNEEYDIKLYFSSDDEFKDLRNIIFVDEINNNKISLLPIDLALFIGFTTLNSLNGGNVPITLTDAFKYISEDKKIRIRKGNKSYQLYEEKMQLFKSFKVKSIIKDRKTNKILIDFKDAIPILDNYRVHIASRGDIGYIIGASAILSILNFISEQEQVEYITTFNTASNYINDSQSNTITILNMKYYIIIKVLQMNNSYKNRKVYNPKINLEDLYEQTALLQQKQELSKTEKQRLRKQIENYLNHLKLNNLLSSYDYEPFNQITTEDSKKTKTQKNTLYLKLQ